MVHERLHSEKIGAQYELWILLHYDVLYIVNEIKYFNSVFVDNDMAASLVNRLSFRHHTTDDEATFPKVNVHGDFK
jgi:hypothetical protein